MNDTDTRSPTPLPAMSRRCRRRPSRRAVGNQRRAVMLAVGLVVAAIWITHPAR